MTARDYFNWQGALAAKEGGTVWKAELPAEYDLPELRIARFNGSLLLAHPALPPVLVHADGTVAPLKFETGPMLPIRQERVWFA